MTDTNTPTGRSASYNLPLLAGAVGLAVSAMAGGLGWLLATAVLYGLIYICRHAHGNTSGAMTGASFLFWAIVLFCPGMLLFGGVSMVLLEVGLTGGRVS